MKTSKIFIDTEKKYGHLMFTGRTKLLQNSTQKRTYHEVLCDCGNKKFINRFNVFNGLTTSCNRCYFGKINYKGKTYETLALANKIGITTTTLYARRKKGVPIDVEKFYFKRPRIEGSLNWLADKTGITKQRVSQLKHLGLSSEDILKRYGQI